VCCVCVCGVLAISVRIKLSPSTRLREFHYPGNYPGTREYSRVVEFSPSTRVTREYSRVLGFLRTTRVTREYSRVVISFTFWKHTNVWSFKRIRLFSKTIACFQHVSRPPLRFFTSENYFSGCYKFCLV